MKNKLMDLLQNELTRLHHNATPSGKLNLESDFENDLYNQEFEIQVQLAFEDLKEEFSDLNSKYGKFYQYGRGGRTVAPSKLIPNHNYAHAIKVENLDASPLELRWLYKELKRFNDYVIAWNKSTPDFIIETMRDEHKEEIENNKNKKRKTRTVTSYE